MLNTLKITSMSSVLIPLFMILIALVIGNNASASQDGSLSYALCKDNIKSVKVTSSRDDAYLTMQLSPSATTDFAKITGQNIGKRLNVVLWGNVINDPIINAPMDTGTIGIRLTKEINAEELKEVIMNDAPDGPCGLMKEAAHDRTARLRH